MVATSDDVERYLKCSLMAATQDYQQVAAASTLEALKWLCKNEFIRSGSLGWFDMCCL